MKPPSWLQVLMAIGGGILLYMAVAYMNGCASFQKAATQITGGETTVHDTSHKAEKGEAYASHETITVTAPAAPAAPAVPAIPAVAASHTMPTAVPLSKSPDVASPLPVPAPVAGSKDPVEINVNGTAIKAPPGSSITYQHDQSGTTQPAVVDHSREAVGKGPSYQTGSPNIDGKFNTTTPDVSLPATPGESGGVNSNGGDGAGSFKTIFQKISQLGWLAKTTGILGLLFIVAAFAYWWVEKVDFVTPALIAGFGVLLLGLAVVIDQYPWMLLVALLVGVALIAAKVYHEKSQSINKTLIHGIEAAPTAAGDAVKAQIAQTATIIGGTKFATTIKHGVTNLKAKLGL